MKTLLSSAGDRIMEMLAELAASAGPALAWVGIGQVLPVCCRESPPRRADCSCATDGQPFDVVKTRLQTSSSARFRGALHCFSETGEHSCLLCA